MGEWNKLPPAKTLHRSRAAEAPEAFRLPVCLFGKEGGDRFSSGSGGGMQGRKEGVSLGNGQERLAKRTGLRHMPSIPTIPNWS